MKITDLSYFVAVADDLNFTSAAEKLFISQQALSKHIAKLEAQLGMPLFIRNPHVQLTQAGEILYQYATKILVVNKEMTLALEDNWRLHHGRLFIGMSYARSRTLLPIILPRFLSLYPNIDFNLTVDQANVMITKLINHDIDLFLGYNNVPQPALESIDLGEDTLYMLIPVRLLGEKPAASMIYMADLDFSRLNHAPFLLYPSGNNIRELADIICKRHNIIPKIVLESLDNELQLALSESGVGITFVPHSMLLADSGKRIQHSKNVVIVPVPSQDFSRRIQILYNKEPPKVSSNFARKSSLFF